MQSMPRGSTMIDGITRSGIYYQRFQSKDKAGDNKNPLLMIMGYGGNLATWSPRFLDRLSEQREIITFDHLGSGKSGNIPETPDLTLADFAKHAKEIVDELELSRVNLLGYSMGGAIALEFIHDWPQLVDKFVLQATTSGGRYYHKASSEVAARMQNPRGDTFDEMYFDFLSISMPEIAIEKHRETLQWICDATRDPATPLYVLQMKLRAFRNFDGADYLAAITNPTLVLHGREDQLMPVGNAIALAKHIPNATLKIIEHCGHYPHIEHQDQVVAAFNEFLG